MTPYVAYNTAKAVSPKDREESELLDEELDDLLDEGLAESPNAKTVDISREIEESSHLLGTWRSTEERSLFVKVAKGFLGAPYRLGGSSVRGLDCSAFVMKIYQLFDISLPRTAREQAHVGMRVNRTELQEGTWSSSIHAGPSVMSVFILVTMNSSTPRRANGPGKSK